MRRLPWCGAVVAASATRPFRVKAADTVPLPPFTHHLHERLVRRRGAGTRRRSALRVIPSRTRPTLRGPIGARRARQPARPALAPPAVGQTSLATLTT